MASYIRTTAADVRFEHTHTELAQNCANEHAVPMAQFPDFPLVTLSPFPGATPQQGSTLHAQLRDLCDEHCLVVLNLFCST